MIDLQKIKQLLHSYEDWNIVARSKTDNYCFEIIKNDQALFYFGANHNCDIQNPQYAKLRSYWERFLETTNTKNAIVLIKGGERRVHESEGLAVRRDSEAGFITLLASQKGIPTYNPEPTPTDEREYVTQEFSEDQLNYYYFARLVDWWHSHPKPKPPFEKFMERYAERREPISNWSDYGFSLQEMMKVHKRLFNTPFNAENQDFFALLINPTRKDNPLHKAVIATSTYRNIHVVQSIERLWREGKNIFIVYGNAHAILQEPALRKLL